MKRPLLLLAFILLLAFALRIYQITEMPPGLTHDEANHGREAIGILDGVYLFYFPLNYGSEPLYSYTVALSMALFGEGLLALRLVNVIFGVAAIGLTAVWASHAFDRRTALLGAALMAVSFWPLASSREALRAGMLPFFMAAAVWFFWHIINLPATDKRRWWLAAAFGTAVAFTLHIYLAARVAWLLFPLFLLYLFLFHRPAFTLAWRPTAAGLLLAGLLVTPMFVYLRLNPEALTRLDMLDGPLQALRAGQWQLVWENVSGALLAFIWPGYGDQFLAYNIPGRPIFDGVTAVFFLLGLLLCLARWRQPAYALLLLWFAVGIIPSLVTGATANTTRNLAALPAVYLLPAVGFIGLVDGLRARYRWAQRPLLTAAALLWLLIAGSITLYDYFSRWGQDPAVRGAYQVNLMAALDYLATAETPPPILISTVYPGPAHDSSIGLVIRPDAYDDLRWIDARHALLWPQGAAAHALIPASTPPHPALAPFLEPLLTRQLRPDDLDPSFTLYRLAPPPELSGQTAVNFGDAVQLMEAVWLDDGVTAGQTAVLLTTWQVTDPAKIGPPVPPAFAPETVFFTQVLTPEGHILTQDDRLDAPAWNWQTGDIFRQIHTLPVPPDTPPGDYQTIVGIYDGRSLQRLPTINATGDPGDTFASAPPLTVHE